MGVQGDWENVSATLKVYGKFTSPSVHFLHLPNFVTTTGHNQKNIGLSKSSVTSLGLTVFFIYTRFQIHVSVSGRVEIYIHIGVQVDTDNLDHL